jgi:hypothetical protein
MDIKVALPLPIQYRHWECIIIVFTGVTIAR